LGQGALCFARKTLGLPFGFMLKASGLWSRFALQEPGIRVPRLLDQAAASTFSRLP